MLTQLHLQLGLSGDSPHVSIPARPPGGISSGPGPTPLNALPEGQTSPSPSPPALCLPASAVNPRDPPRGHGNRRRLRRSRAPPARPLLAFSPPGHGRGRSHLLLRRAGPSPLLPGGAPSLPPVSAAAASVTSG